MLKGIISNCDITPLYELIIQIVEPLRSGQADFEKLEEICTSYEGVEKSYAIQAGREVRIMIAPEQINDEKMVIVARDIAKRIETEMDYPGQIKVHLIRESRAIEFAK